MKLSGLPFRISSDEIHEWITDLSDVKAEKVHMISNRQGLASGEAYVELKEKAHAKSVLEACDEKNIGSSNRYVKIVDATEQELKWQLKRQDLFKGTFEIESEPKDNMITQMIIQVKMRRNCFACECMVCRSKSANILSPNG